MERLISKHISVLPYVISFSGPRTNLLKAGR